MRRRRPYYSVLLSSYSPYLTHHFLFFLFLLSLLVRGLLCDEESTTNSFYNSNKLSNNNDDDDGLKPVDVKDFLSRLSSSSSSSSQNETENQHDQSLKHAPHRHHNKPNHQRGPDFDSELIVNTQNGLVRGKAVYLDYHLNKNVQNTSSYSYPYGKKRFRVNAWLGIPFAEKPIGDLRFKRPVSVKNWNGVFNATEWPNSCYQLVDTVITEFEGVDMWNPNTNISEDCLYLNIWTPHPRPRNAAVMVWIYGGGFIAGTSTLKVYDPRIIVAETQVIFVSIQYRISIFGFLYMNHEDAPGNQGLIDQNLALKWIQNNIQYFGGDSSKITIFGESAGSVSVSLHLLSPLSSNLFHNAIMESGTALSDWALLSYEDAMERYSGILQHIGCNSTNVTEALECAREVDPKTAIEKSDEYFYSKAIHGVAQFTFLPVVDNYFLEEEPISMLNRGKFKKCPILLGGNRDEGNWLFVYAFPEYRNLTVRPALDYDTFKDFVTSLYYFYPQYPAVSSSAVLNAIIYRYTTWQNVNNYNHNFENLDDAAGDFHFVCPTLDFANIYAMNRQDVFFYYYTQRSSRHFWPEWLGVMHGDEISFVFGEPLYPELNYTYEEKILTRKILKYWSNFAKYSDPNGPPNEAGRTASDDYYRTPIKPSERLKTVQSRYRTNASSSPVMSSQTMLQTAEFWPKYKIDMNPYSDEQRAYLTLNSRKVEVGYNLRAEYCAFWGTFLPTLMLSEPRCDCASCNRNPYKLQSKSSAAIHFSSLLNLNDLFSLTAYLMFWSIELIWFYI